LAQALLQFPISFKNTTENLAYVRTLTAPFREYALVLEIRHASWNEERMIEAVSEDVLQIADPE
jgi:uncharacterized protein YecE (DUF72 family)